MRRVVRWTGQKPRLWDPATGELQRTEGDNPRFSSILGVTFSPDGRLLATCWTDNTVRLWGLATGVLQRTFEHTQRHVTRVHGVTCSPDGRLLASWGDDGTSPDRRAKATMQDLQVDPRRQAKGRAHALTPCFQKAGMLQYAVADLALRVMRDRRTWQLAGGCCGQDCGQCPVGRFWSPFALWALAP
jgi:hypothetical protein